MNTLHLRAIERKEAIRKEFDKILKEVREQEVGKLTLLREQTRKEKGRHLSVENGTGEVFAPDSS